MAGHKLVPVIALGRRLCRALVRHAVVEGARGVVSLLEPLVPLRGPFSVDSTHQISDGVGFGFGGRAALIWCAVPPGRPRPVPASRRWVSTPEESNPSRAQPAAAPFFGESNLGLRAPSGLPPPLSRCRSPWLGSAPPPPGRRLPVPGSRTQVARLAWPPPPLWESTPHLNMSAGNRTRSGPASPPAISRGASPGLRRTSERCLQMEVGTASPRLNAPMPPSHLAHCQLSRAYTRFQPCRPQIALRAHHTPGPGARATARLEWHRPTAARRRQGPALGSRDPARPA